MTYPVIENIFQKFNDTLSAAEAHGIAAGMLCANNPIQFTSWLTEILSKEAAITTGEKELLMSLFNQTKLLLSAEDFSFDLFLPDDDSPLPERIAALKDWCQGFVYGFGFVHADTQWQGESREILKDIIEFSKLDNETEGNEEDENAYAEITEYLRAAIMLLREEQQRIWSDKHRQLH